VGTKKNFAKKLPEYNDYILYDLAQDSLLEPLSLQNKTFRVGDYDPKMTIKNHRKGIHKYFIAREVINADIIINLPKLKHIKKLV